MKLPVKDRIAQHMWDNVVNPLIDNKLYYHSYACRVNKGSHAASKQLNDWLYYLICIRKKTVYAIKADIYNYFWNIHHDILFDQFCRFIGDDKTLDLTYKFISQNGILLPIGIGIPVGNLSSQIFANLYGNILDEFVKNYLKCKYYIRYMDDFIILGENYKELESIFDQIQHFLFERMRCVLNNSSTILYANEGIDFVGFRHYGSYIVPTKISKKRFDRFIQRFINGTISIDEFLRSYNSVIGHLKHANTYNLFTKVNEILREQLPIHTFDQIDYNGINSYPNWYVEYPLFSGIKVKLKEDNRYVIYRKKQ